MNDGAGAAVPVAAVQITGERAQQEDSLDVVYIEPDEGEAGGEWLLVLADGMGGHVGGATASQLAVKTFSDTYIGSGRDVREALRLSLQCANDRLAQEIAERPELGEMGTTLTAAVIGGGRLRWISVGDSPLWLYRDGVLQRLNADHSMVPILQGLVEIGRMSETEAALDPRRNQLRSALMGEELALVDLPVEPVGLRPGDIVLLASDGVETVSENALASLLSAHQSATPEVLAEAVMEAVEAARRPGQDNASLILFRGDSTAD